MMMGDALARARPRAGSSPRRCSRRPRAVVELVDRVLELRVEDAPVGDDDDRVEDPLVVPVQLSEAVREPRDAVRLAAPGRVLDEVVVARPLRPRRRLQLPHGVELVIAREDHGLVVTFLPATTFSSTWTWTKRPRMSRKLSRCQTSSQR